MATVRAVHGRTTRLRMLSRLCFAAALTVLTVGTLAAFGAVGYAVSSAKDAVETVTVGDVARHSPARDQYGQGGVLPEEAKRPPRHPGSGNRHDGEGRSPHAGTRGA